MTSNGIGCHSCNGQPAAAWREKMFKKADQDGDGKITKDELKSVLPKKTDASKIDAIFQKIDTNQDGSIDATEHEAALKAKPRHGPHEPPKPEDLAKKLIGKADGDGDGKLSQDDLTSFLSRSHSKVNAAELFKAIDTDQDGSVTESELTQVFQNFRPRKHGEEHETEHSESTKTQEKSETHETQESQETPKTSATPPPQSTPQVGRSEMRALIHALRETEGYRRTGAPVRECSPHSAFSAVA